MKDLLEAVTIMAKYSYIDEEWPTNCEHDILRFNKIDLLKVSQEDIKRLEELGFEADTEEGAGFYSFRFGSN